MTNQNQIRNFCIIAHIDHGKSTLADRMLEITGTVAPDKMKPQMLDRNPIERERGITIKLQPVRMVYRAENSKPQTLNSKQIQNNKIKISKPIVSNLEFRASSLLSSEYILNLIDTPGHVDFSYEVSRSLAAVEGAILLVDASQGVQAQTLANLQQAQKLGLTIIPVINKIDLPHAEPEKTALELVSLLKISQDDIIFASGKTGDGVEEILEAIVDTIPPPSGNADAPLRALIFDSLYDRHRGVVTFVRIVDGSIKQKDDMTLIGSAVSDSASEVGYFVPDQFSAPQLTTGEIGYIVTSLRDIRLVRVGDTITSNQKSKACPEYARGIKNKNYRDENNQTIPLTGYKQPEPMVYASVFPLAPGDYPLLKDSLEKYALTDGSLSITPENSPVLGFGYRLGFLGLLHVEIVSERLSREYGLELLVTTPHVEYQIAFSNGEEKIITSAVDLPDASHIREIREPWAHLVILSPSTYVGSIIELLQSHRCDQPQTVYQSEKTVEITVDIPLSELIVTFYDELKSISSGYASMSYERTGFRIGKLVKLDIRIADDAIDALSAIVPSDRVDTIAKEKVAKLKDIVPRQQFEVKIQAALGGRVIASERISAMRKDVTAKLYGGDVTRKNKLLKKQAKGKKRLRQFGRISLSSDVFIKLLRR